MIAHRGREAIGALRGTRTPMAQGRLLLRQLRLPVPPGGHWTIEGMVPPVGFEPTPSRLQNGCSTTELRRRSAYRSGRLRKLEIAQPSWKARSFEKERWLRSQDSNLGPPGHDPGELITAPLRQRKMYWCAGEDSNLRALRAPAPEAGASTGFATGAFDGRGPMRVLRITHRARLTTDTPPIDHVPGRGRIMVGPAGSAPAAFAMSTRRSTAELRALKGRDRPTSGQPRLMVGQARLELARRGGTGT